ncbi:hypothetical protein AGOR_G00205880 [Albula goreensis]|uniref:Uncharacterized protein n=1 Tax=Albula goreensis TaxID=1534307 RepID=A0A8T3CP61_9TELE|nr:hypothetical protein AGOR_G00205880 [Albula goreensis]
MGKEDHLVHRAHRVLLEVMVQREKMDQEGSREREASLERKGYLVTAVSKAHRELKDLQVKKEAKEVREQGGRRVSWEILDQMGRMEARASKDNQALMAETYMAVKAEKEVRGIEVAKVTREHRDKLETKALKDRRGVKGIMGKWVMGDRKGKRDHLEAQVMMAIGDLKDHQVSQSRRYV